MRMKLLCPIEVLLDRLDSMALTTPRLVGRTVELAGIAARLEAAAVGHGGLVLISGEPGIGKSSLAITAAEQARQRGFQVALGRSRETDGAPAYI